MGAWRGGVYRIQTEKQILTRYVYKDRVCLKHVVGTEDGLTLARIGREDSREVGMTVAMSGACFGGLRWMAVCCDSCRC